MRTPAFALLIAALLTPSAARAEGCDGRNDLGVARVVSIDTSGGPIYGDITRASKEASFLKPREVVLTFDDGPMPWVTKSILDTLDRFCTKATFFSVGRMAIAYPETTKEILARGHTLGAHTWSHPLNIARLKPDKAREEIERGFAAVSLAAGQPIAPFFRFPGLSDSPGLLAHLQSRGIAAFTVDVVSDDSFIGDPARLLQVTLQRTESRQGGIVLFHDIKVATAKALPAFLAEIKARGYKVVHLKAKQPVAPVTTFDAELGPTLAKATVASAGKKPPLMPFYGAAGPLKTADADVPVTELAPEPRERIKVAALKPSTAEEANERRRKPIGLQRPTSATAPAVGSWATTVRPRKRPPTEDN